MHDKQISNDIKECNSEIILKKKNYLFRVVIGIFLFFKKIISVLFRLLWAILVDEAWEESKAKKEEARIKNEKEKKIRKEKEELEQLKKERGANMILVNTDYISGKTLETLGLVSGSVGVFTTSGDKDIKKIMQYMIDEASVLNADAIINIRYTTMGPTHILVSGTAVKFI